MDSERETLEVMRGMKGLPRPAFLGTSPRAISLLPSFMSRPLCCFDYLYRDASNYKGYGSVLLWGEATPENEAAIRAALIDGIYFEAERVGVSTLYHLVRGDSEADELEDHAWHEFVGIRDVGKGTGMIEMERLVGLLKEAGYRDL